MLIQVQLVQVLNQNKVNIKQQLDDELHRLIIRSFQKHKVYSSFMNNMYGLDLATVQQSNWFFLCVIDILSKFA